MKRWDLAEYGDPPYEMDDGDWCKWEDVSGLLTSLRRANTALTQCLTTVNKLTEDALKAQTARDKFSEKG